MMIKKGEMTIATIVAIALAVVVLIFLIYGFSTGWGNLWDRITTFGGIGEDGNEDDQVMRCNILKGSGREDGSEWKSLKCDNLLKKIEPAPENPNSDNEN